MSTIPMSLRAQSAIPGMLFPALVSPQAACLHSLFLQLEQTQWLSPEDLASLRNRQLDALLTHVWTNVPWYHNRLSDAGLVAGPFNTSSWLNLKPLTRREVQEAGSAMHAASFPKEHGRASQAQTSGSTGEPVVVMQTELDQLFWQAFTLRDHAWHERDVTGTLCTMRAFVPSTPNEKWNQGWGDATNAFYGGGRSATLPIDTDVALVPAWLEARNPDYLLIYPTVLQALLLRLQKQKISLPKLRGVRTISEILPDATRELCREVLGVSVVDLYSSIEVGNIALQCPQSGLYHTHDENVFVEVIRADGAPCEAGETGRVLVTKLHSFAMPLLRYEMRDYAQVGPPCPCGRGLKTLQRIHGRVRNMVVGPNGSVRWPILGFAKFRNVAPVRQYQVVQLALDQLEFRLVTERALEPSEQTALVNILREAIGNFSRIDVRYFPDLPQGRNGKFEEFISLVSDEAVVTP